MDKDYYREYAGIQQTHWWYTGRVQLLQSVLEHHLRPSQERRLLDLGCGPGGMRPMLAQYGRLFSADFTIEALQFAQPQSLGHLLQADATKLPFGDASFDVVCAFDLIEHLADDFCALSEFNRVLKPGGWVFVTVPAFQFLWGSQDVVNHHYRRYRCSQIRHLLTRTGFLIEQTSYFNAFLFLPIAIVRLLSTMRADHRRESGEEVQSDFSIRIPKSINTALHHLFAFERHLLRRSSLPLGTSVLCIARKPKSEDE